MAKPLSIMYVASEVVPFAKTGGLADVAGAMPQIVRELGHDIRIMMPKYASVSERIFKIHDIKRLTDIPIKVGDETHLGSIKSSFITNLKSKVQVYFLHNSEYFDRPGLYTDPKTLKDYPDNDDRFIFFARSVVQTLNRLGWIPDILHINDWQSGLIAAYARTIFRDEPQFKKIKIVFTVHNAAYQGIFDKSSFYKTGLPEEFFSPDYLEFNGKLNCLKAGLMFSDAITTVSPTYAKEIQSSPEYGCGLESLFYKLRRKTKAILNGADYSVWNPETDELIAATYSTEDLAPKLENKKELAEYFKLKFDPKTPIIGMVSRLVDQKGLDLLVKALKRILAMKCQLVILGTGEEKYHRLLKEAAKANKKQMGLELAFDEKLAHLIEAGSDMFLMPSKYEPCGLNQFYSLRYGTLPIVRKTGGLADTVVDLNEQPNSGTGFVFETYDARELVATVKRALAAFKDEKCWQRAMIRAMNKDFSWNKSAAQYIDLYRKLMKK